MYNVKLPPTRQDVDGGYLIKGVTLLAAGKWNGITYTTSSLHRAQYSWRDNTIWNRHYEGIQRDESNRIGHIKNQRFEDDAIVGDVFLSNENENGQDMIHYVRTNQLNGISVEHVNIDEHIGDELFATDISFLGAAVVPTPACTVCQLSKGEFNMEQKDFDKLSGTVAELAKNVQELTKVDVESIVKKQSEIDGKIIAELSARIAKIEKTPVHNTTTELSDIEDGYADIVVERGMTKRSDE